MADLRTIAAEAGGTDVATHLQSGNLVATIADPVDAVRDRMGALLHERLELDLAIITRSASDWQRVIDANPHPTEAEADPRTVHVAFLPEAAAPGLASVDDGTHGPSSLTVAETEVYLHLPNGMARDELMQAFGRTPEGRAATVRNWNTVLAVGELLAG